MLSWVSIEWCVVFPLKRTCLEVIRGEHMNALVNAKVVPHCSCGRFGKVVPRKLAEGTWKGRGWFALSRVALSRLRVCFDEGMKRHKELHEVPYRNARLSIYAYINPYGGFGRTGVDNQW